jgi:hypothetical protein
MFPYSYGLAIGTDPEIAGDSSDQKRVTGRLCSNDEEICLGISWKVVDLSTEMILKLAADGNWF